MNVMKHEVDTAQYTWAQLTEAARSGDGELTEKIGQSLGAAWDREHTVAARQAAVIPEVGRTLVSTEVRL